VLARIDHCSGQLVPEFHQQKNSSLIMTATKPKSVFSACARALVPAVAVTLSWGTASQAQASDAGRAAINAKLAEFAAETTLPGKPIVAKTILTAPADQLALAVYEILQEGTFTGTDPALDDAAELAQSALQAITSGTTLKARADKDKISGRIVNAAIQGAGAASDATVVAAILDAVLDVNATTGNTKLQLTLAGAANATAQALKSAEGTDAGDEIAAVSVPTASATDKAAQDFVTATLKAVGTSAANVKSFVDRALDNVNAPDAFVLNVARAIAAKQPAVAGAVIGARAANLPTDAGVTTLATNATRDPKLAKAIADIVASTGEEVTDVEAFAVSLATGVTAANKGAIAQGALRAAGIAQTSDIIDAILGIADGKAVLDKAAFAGQAAAGNGDSGIAAQVALEIANDFADLTNKTKVGVAVIKAIAVSSPDAAQDVAFNIAASAGAAIDNNLVAQQKLVQDLAKAAPTNAIAAGSAVAGVVDEANTTAANQLAITAAAIKVASKATVGIAEQVSSLGDVANKQAFATGLVGNDPATNKPYVTAALAGSVAAGVALTDTANTGDIAAAVASANVGTQAQTLKIAGTVASVVDIERIADVGQEITELMSVTPPAGSKLPKLSSISALALSLAKAINTKPLNSRLEFNDISHANRVDELGELAAAMTAAALQKTTDQKILASIGTSIFKALSSKLLPNAGNLAADFRDAAGDIAGSIAQTISMDSTLAVATREALLASNSVLVTTLAKAAKTFGAEVTTAFNNVRTAGVGTIFVDPDASKNEAIGVNGTATTTGKYEIGFVIDPETPSKNI
jgi:hypothetical protein